MSVNENDRTPREDGPAEEPIVRDRRRIDPETGQARTSADRPEQTAAGQDGPAPANDAEEHAEQASAASEDGDALAQAQRILDDLGEDVTVGTGPQAAESDREAELESDLRRLQAEYVNYKRRVDRDRDVAKDQGVLTAVTALLPVLDDLDAARAAGDLAEGPFAAIAAKLDAALAGLGLEREDQEALAGVEFDPARHEAVMRQPHPEVPADHVVQVFRNGYIRGGRVLRAAQVMVSAGAE